MVPVMYSFGQKKTGWATFWATFSQTHLVTLAATQKEVEAEGNSGKECQGPIQ
jgi:hypothetical protein